jgi:hypothetical protein
MQLISYLCDRKVSSYMYIFSNFFLCYIHFNGLNDGLKNIPTFYSVVIVHITSFVKRFFIDVHNVEILR